jgi:N utilization substance protein A
VPEVFSGEIEIRKIVREPGIRTKVCVSSTEATSTPPAAAWGPRAFASSRYARSCTASRLTLWCGDESPEQFIANAIGADLVERVYLADRGKFARVIVNEKNKNLAIGKKGKNVKLAAKLSDYKLDITPRKSSTRRSAKSAASPVTSPSWTA